MPRPTMPGMVAGPRPSPASPSSAPPAGPDIPVPTGLVIEPFRALRFELGHPDVAGALAALTSPPYDVIDDNELRALEGAHRHNVVRLILPRDLPGEPASRYRRAATTLTQWRVDGVLRPDPRPALYLYEQAGGGHVQRGLVGALALVPPDAGIVLPHENTMAGPVADRLALAQATMANLEPIFLTYDGGGVVASAVASAVASQPLMEAGTPDGLTHRVWALSDPILLAAIAADLLPRRAVIADGHHRYATYLQHQADRHAAGAGPGAWDFGLTLLVDATVFGPQVQAIHRVVPGLPVTEAARRAAGGFSVQPVAGDLAAGLRALTDAGRDGVAVLLAGRGEQQLVTRPDPTALARAVPRDRSAAWRRLDVTVVHSLLISQLWRLADTEDVVGYQHDAAAALERAITTRGTAVLLNPTPVTDVLAVAAAGERMPRKSTLFTPKPRTGLLMRAFADQLQ